jgi:uncharacterized spore protein YtfJ
MIDYVVGGEYLNVTSHKGAIPYVNMSGTNPMIGVLAFDAGSQSMKVFDGNNWLTVGGGSANINLTPNAVNILKWAEQKMVEDMRLKALAEKHPAINDLLNQIKEKEDQIKMVQTLLESPGDNGIKPSMIP